ncbi:MAG: hypothetical protein HWE20_06195 [Gammaproteobacteria bacterium]|nr:hypothetical protein [Gammaproteobacteria bacterium]
MDAQNPGLENTVSDVDQLLAALQEASRIIRERDRALEDKAQTIDLQSQQIHAKNAQNNELRKQLPWFKEQLRLAMAKRFGRSSEKHRAQEELFDEAEVLVVQE